MKQLMTIIMAIPLAAGIMGFTQCDTLLFFKAGTKTTITTYDKDGKVTGSVKTTFLNVNNTDSGQAVTASQEHYDKKGKQSGNGEYIIRCSKGILYFDMKMMMPQVQADAYKDMEMTVEGADMEIPSSLTVGNALKDVNITFHFKPKNGTGPMPSMSFSVLATNRKVEAKESITTAAGTFECYKITEDMEVKSIFNMKMKSIHWFSTQSGTIKTESYKENGKLTGSTVLTKLVK